MSNFIPTDRKTFSEATVTAAKTPLNELLDVDATSMPSPTPVVLTPLEYGFANVRTLKLANRTMVPVEPVIARAVADHERKVIDSLIQDELANATNKQFTGAATSIGTTAATMTLTADLVRKAVLQLRVNQSVPWFGDLYAVGIHPTAVYELRRETGSGGWRLPNEYGVNQDNIWNGEIGAFEGVRFVQNARTRVAADGAIFSTDDHSAADGKLITHSISRSVFSWHWLAEDIPHTNLSPRAQAEDIGEMLVVPSSLHVVISATGFPT